MFGIGIRWESGIGKLIISRKQIPRIRRICHELMWLDVDWKAMAATTRRWASINPPLGRSLVGFFLPAAAAARQNLLRGQGISHWSDVSIWDKDDCRWSMRCQGFLFVNAWHLFKSSRVLLSCSVAKLHLTRLSESLQRWGDALMLY